MLHTRVIASVAKTNFMESHIPTSRVMRCVVSGGLSMIRDICLYTSRL